MDTVYARSKLTVIAASSTSCHSGFLDIRLCYTVLTVPRSSPFQIDAQAKCKSGFHTLRYLGSESIPDSIDTRGWTLQEELLSSKYLMFTEDDIQWSCRGNRTCMCGQRLPNRSASITLGSYYPDERESHWKRFTEEESRRSFTRDTDKLVAISSIARRVEAWFEVPKGQMVYIAGLWSCIFVRHLNWRSCPESGRMTDAYVAPRFSWASLNYDSTGIEHMETFEELMCELREAQTTPIMERDEFGPISSGFAVLYGPVIRGKVVLPPENY